MQVFVALVVVVITLLVVYLKYLEGYWRRRGIAHDKPKFPFGNMKEFRKSKHMVELLDPVYKKYKGTGPFAGFYFLLQPAALAMDLDFIKNVLIKDFNNFIDRGVFHNERDDPLTENLFALDGENWRALRNKLSSTFTSGKMKMMFPTVLEVGDELVRVLGEKVKSEPKSILEVTDLVSRFTADVIGTCAFGLQCNSLRNPNAEFVIMGKRVLVERAHNKVVDAFIDSFPKLARKLRMRQFPEEIEKFYTRIVREAIEYRETHDVQRNDFMKMLIEIKNQYSNGKSKGTGLTFEEIVAQSFLFLVAGFETSSTTMGFALYELARNQDIQDRLREDINEVLNNHDGQFTYDSMAEMKYMQQVISETLRIYPILPTLVRKAENRYETGDPKFYIEKGSTVIIPVHAIHTDPEIYPEPEKFDPSRFEEDAVKARHACAWLPFGEGPRNCIGLRFGKMQAHIGLALILKNFRVSVCEKTTPISWINENILLSAKNGIHLKLEQL